MPDRPRDFDNAREPGERAGDREGQEHQPIGILIAGLFLALTFIGGEGAQISLKVPLDVTKVFQGILLFYVLACDSLIVYRIRLLRSVRKVAHAAS